MNIMWQTVASGIVSAGLALFVAGLLGLFRMHAETAKMEEKLDNLEKLIENHVVHRLDNLEKRLDSLWKAIINFS